ncbi:hypothetical protein GUJ93_ZPchr0011g28338, partial [Zizania palustris]
MGQTVGGRASPICVGKHLLPAETLSWVSLHSTPSMHLLSKLRTHCLLVPQKKTHLSSRQVVKHFPTSDCSTLALEAATIDLSNLDLVLASGSPENPSSPSPLPKPYDPLMANYPVDPFPFVPRRGVLSDGGGELCKLRRVITLLGQHIKRNEGLAIAKCEGHFDLLECQEFLHLIHHHITQVL